MGDDILGLGPPTSTTLNMSSAGGGAPAMAGSTLTTESMLQIYKGMINSPNPNISATARKIYKLLLRKMEIAQVCGTPLASDSWAHTCRFGGPGVMVTGLVAIGIVGNILSFLTILSLPKRNLFNNLLLALSVFDTLFVSFGGLFFMQQAYKFEYWLYTLLFPKVIYPLAGISMTASSYTCIAIALERCLGICYSHLQSVFVIRKARWYVVAILTVALVIDAPRFFEIKHISDNATGQVVDFGYSEIRRNQTYIRAYTLVFRLVMTAGVPFLLMLVCNFRILCYYKANRFAFGGGNGGSQSNLSPAPNPSGGPHQGLMTQQSVVSTATSGGGSMYGRAAGGGGRATKGGGGNGTQSTRTLYLTFIGLSIGFLVCHSPRIYLNAAEVFVNTQKRRCTEEFESRYHEPTWVICLSSLDKVLLVANSSVNFVIYCMVGKSFRQHMCKTLFGWCGWCVKKVTGLDLATTTAGTGETIVPDAESRTGGGLSSVRGGSSYYGKNRNRLLSSDMVSFGDHTERLASILGEVALDVRGAGAGEDKKDTHVAAIAEEGLNSSSVSEDPQPPLVVTTVAEVTAEQRSRAREDQEKKSSSGCSNASNASGRQAGGFYNLNIKVAISSNEDDDEEDEEEDEEEGDTSRPLTYSSRSCSLGADCCRCRCSSCMLPTLTGDDEDDDDDDDSSSDLDEDEDEVEEEEENDEISTSSSVSSSTASSVSSNNHLHLPGRRETATMKKRRRAAALPSAPPPPTSSSTPPPRPPPPRAVPAVPSSSSPSPAAVAAAARAAAAAPVVATVASALAASRATPPSRRFSSALNFLSPTGSFNDSGPPVFV